MENYNPPEESFVDLPASTFIRNVSCKKDDCLGCYTQNHEMKTIWGESAPQIPHRCNVCGDEVYLALVYPLVITITDEPQRSVTIRNGKLLREYDVWSEGYSATGQRSTAQFHGRFKGTSFTEACQAWAATSIQPEYFNLKSLTYWGCKLFDNEEDARKAFG